MFKKSSFCAIGLCVEVSLPEFKASSMCVIGACVEISTDKSEVCVRHSKHPEQVLTFSAEEWRAFIAGVKNGEFDLSE